MSSVKTFFKNFILRGICLVACLGFSLETWSQSIEQLAERQQTRLEGATERLKTLRREIRDEQIPLGKTLADLRQEADSFKLKLREHRRMRDSASLSLEQMEAQVQAGSKELTYVTGNLLNEFESSLKAALSAGETMSYGEELRELDLFLERSETPENERLSASLNMLQTAFTRMEGLLGGKKYAGTALGPEGNQIAGDFIQVGPLLYFASSDGGTVGWVQETKTLQPKVRSIDSSEADLISKLAKTGRGSLPFDPTLGDAVALAETKESWQEHLKKGGIWVIPILGFAILSMVVAVYKSIQIFFIRQPQPLVVHQIIDLLRKDDSQGALSLASSQPGPTAEMLTQGVKHSGESVELVEEVMFESILGAQPKLERFLNVIAITAATAPLLGLLGTVTGIIKTFKLMEIFGAGDPKPLISGISEALITTELGLVLAIPALIAHALLSRKVAGTLSQMEKLSVAFVNGLSRKNAGIKTAHS